jgi:endonuclease/exonuclease/phosphatase family metal-dependent hydrolase
MNAKDPGYTWPAGKFYQKEPVQRVDIIYTKNLKIVASAVYDEGVKWLSDHRMVVTDIVI